MRHDATDAPVGDVRHVTDPAVDGDTLTRENHRGFCAIDGLRLHDRYQDLMGSSAG